MGPSHVCIQVPMRVLESYTVECVHEANDASHQACIPIIHNTKLFNDSIILSSILLINSYLACQFTCSISPLFTFKDSEVVVG